MGRKELLVFEVKKAFLDLLEKMDNQALLALKELKVTRSCLLSQTCHAVVYPMIPSKCAQATPALRVSLDYMD